MPANLIFQVRFHDVSSLTFERLCIQLSGLTILGRNLVDNSGRGFHAL